MLNEHIIRLPGCPTDTDLCPVEIFEKVFEDSIHHCAYDEWCDNETYKPLYEDFLRRRTPKVESPSSPGLVHCID